MRHKVEQGGRVVGGGVVFRWVVISLVDYYVSVEFELGVGGVGGVLVRTVIRGSLRRVWRGGGETKFEVVDGQVWGAKRLMSVVFIVMAVHGGGGIVAFCNLCYESDLSVGCVREIEVKIGGRKKKRMERRGKRVSKRDLKLRPLPSRPQRRRLSGR